MCLANSDYVAIITTIISAITGVSGALLGVQFSNKKLAEAEDRRFEEKKRNITAAIYSEISAILKINEVRGYQKMLDEELNRIIQLNKYPVLDSFLVVKFEVTYFPVYKANVSNIGLLDVDIATLVVEFYQTISAVLEDATTQPGRSYSNAVTMVKSMKYASPIEESEINRVYLACVKKALRENGNLLRKATAIGHEICDIIEQRYNFDKKD